ncbi:hypothetical protein SDC9_119424 [bioreactor metagenome]|uniref:Cytoplasmic protein n=1 Tax=bioreactor metagenome TaxID=1076179 RepID=A0A645C4Z7_9ZZZZ
MGSKYSAGYIKKAHDATLYNEHHIEQSSICTCFYCGYRFNPKEEELLQWLDETSIKGRTLACPMCLVDCILGDDSGFPVTNLDFINACTEEWFGGNSRISGKVPVENSRPIQILVD